MSFDPTAFIGEVLGEPADRMRNPVNAGYQCPFSNSECIKRSHRVAGPYPVCSVWQSRALNRLICLCPRRFFEADIQSDVIKNCWSGPPPENPRIAYEVKMESFGTVDFVIADVDSDNSVREFISVELQAVDCTGSVEPAYNALLNSQMLEKRPVYGVNWANVRKRYVNQLITKGIYHHHWRTKIISVIQSPLYDRLRQDIRFDELSPTSPNSNVVFMMYDFQPASDNTFSLKLDKVVGTSHNSLMMAGLYRQTPDKQAFCKKIIERLRI